MDSKKYLLLYILPLFLWMSFIIYVSSVSDVPTIRGVVTQQPVPKGAWTGDDIEHIGVYSILAFLFFRAIRETKWQSSAVPVTILFCVIFGLSDELHQLFVPERTFSLLDIFWDFLGGLSIRIVSSFI